jgi:hypothetical protein
MYLIKESFLMNKNQFFLASLTLFSLTQICLGMEFAVDFLAEDGASASGLHNGLQHTAERGSLPAGLRHHVDSPDILYFNDLTRQIDRAISKLSEIDQLQDEYAQYIFPVTNLFHNANFYTPGYRKMAQEKIYRLANTLMVTQQTKPSFYSTTPILTALYMLRPIFEQTEHQHTLDNTLRGFVPAKMPAYHFLLPEQRCNHDLAFTIYQDDPMTLSPTERERYYASITREQHDYAVAERRLLQKLEQERYTQEVHEAAARYQTLAQSQAEVTSPAPKKQRTELELLRQENQRLALILAQKRSALTALLEQQTMQARRQKTKPTNPEAATSAAAVHKEKAKKVLTQMAKSSDTEGGPCAMEQTPSQDTALERLYQQFALATRQ